MHKVHYAAVHHHHHNCSTAEGFINTVLSTGLSVCFQVKEKHSVYSISANARCPYICNRRIPTTNIRIYTTQQFKSTLPQLISIMAVQLAVCTLLLCLVALAMANSCPTWFTNSTGHCECGNELNGYVKCSQETHRVYSSVPSDPTQLNAAICGPYSREGLFCGYYSEGFGPSPFPSKYCANCSDITMGSAISFP